ncbi:MAG: aminotransferase class V-fold PLP-dependent enzyme [Lachnospiraceae bacterium]|nr:aminotransferase class V-fold PLP-dependent enzyme [Lachnospiraceae bacterium]
MNRSKEADPSLADRLITYGQSAAYPFHMPGHKRQFHPFFDPYTMDITEIYGFDNLHHAEGILLEAQQRAAYLYHASETFYLVNGSTCGILAAVAAATKRGGKILMARNCHKAAYHAALLNDLEVSYLYPAADMTRGLSGAIDPDEVEEMLKKDASLRTVLITSPTYDGVCSDVRRIAEIVHQHDGILIVDEAHGAHFGMHPYFPEHALSCGADLVINSVHKTLPSLTQTALLHVQGTRVDRERLKSFLGIYQTSSPSYVLMAGIDACVRLLLEHGTELFDAFAKRLERLRAQLSDLQVLELIRGTEPKLQAYDYDRSKILIATQRSSLSGSELSEILRSQYQLEMEMDSEHYVTAITTIADTEEGLDRLAEALIRIDAGLERRPEQMAQPLAMWKNEAVLRIQEAVDAGKKSLPLVQSEGTVSAEFVYLYPPGIPLLVPGERISGELLEKLLQYRADGFALEGMADYRGEEIRVVDMQR